MIELTIAMVIALLLVCFVLEVVASHQKYLLEHLAILLFGMLVGAAACVVAEPDGVGVDGVVHRRIYFLEFSEKVFPLIYPPPSTTAIYVVWIHTRYPFLQ